MARLRRSPPAYPNLIPPCATPRCNRVFSELMLRQWVAIAICEAWTVRRAAEIARNAGTFNPEICAWLNQHADPSRLARPDPLPVPETARETRDRCFAQPLVHR